MMKKEHILSRFLNYVKIDTQSDPKSQTTPSTEKQWNLAKKLVDELKLIGMEEVKIDENAYVTASLSANISHPVPTIGFIAHFDTSPDFSGKKVEPKVIENYNGENIVLNKEKGIILSPKEFEDLLLYRGQTLITTSGDTLLGADDKAGVCEIISAMEHLINHPEIPHGKIRVAFTPDEEIGRGAHHFDVEKFGADWAYTVDGGKVGELEYENFNAAAATITIIGKSVHPGYAKDKLINATHIAADFIQTMPKSETPENTEGYEGFFHLNNIEGNVAKTTLEYIIRDHDRLLFEERKKQIKNLGDKINEKLDEKRIQVEVVDQYYNMKEKIMPAKHIVAIAESAMKALGIEPDIKAIRGGTDGSQLSFMGLPCPNIFAGGHNFHGPFEYIPLESMIKATEVILKITELTAMKYERE